MAAPGDSNQLGQIDLARMASEIAAVLGHKKRTLKSDFAEQISSRLYSPYLTRSCANASIVVGPWNFSVPGLPKWIQPELKLFTISM